LNFFKILFGSFAIGVGVALLSALLFKYIDLEHHPTVEIMLLILFSLCSYALSDAMLLSGIVTILFCGIGMSHYTFNNLSPKAQFVSKKLFKVLALTSETFVFVYLGLAVFAYDPLNQEYDIGFITLSFPIILIARALNIFPLSFLLNLIKKKNKIKCNAQIMLWFAGLRGAIAFTLALDVPTISNKIIFSNTVIIVLFTVFIFGGLTIPILKCLRIKMGRYEKTKKDEIEFETSNMFINLDRKYMKSFFTKKRSGDQPFHHHHKQDKTTNPSEELSHLQETQTHPSEEVSHQQEPSTQTKKRRF